jgi:hypothetical protein
MAFASTGGGAAVGNASVTRQGLKAGATDINQVKENASEVQRFKNKAEAADQARKSASNAKKPAPTASNAAPPIQPKLAPASKGGTFQFPSDFPYQYFLMMKFGPYRRQVALENQQVDHDLFIVLPMPANLGESFGATYNSVSMGPFGGELIKGISGIASDVSAGVDFKKSITDKITDGLRKLNNSDGTLTATLLSQATKGSEALNLGVNMLYGMTPNPNLAVGIQGIPLRTYSFSWKLAPRSAAESQTLIDIIFHLKQRMHPLKEGFALRYPDYCNVSLHSSGVLKDLIPFKRSVLVDMKVNYAPNGLPSFFAKTQTPTEMELSLTFHETEVFTRVDFETIPQVGK